jgi:hypothetical protein
MKQRPTDPQQKTGLPPKTGLLPTTLPEAVSKQKQKAEQRAIAGRHRNDGAKAHKGVR